VYFWVDMADERPTISLREKQVVLPPSGVFPLQTFCFLSKNKICLSGDNQRFYQRRRRGAHIAWLECSVDDSVDDTEPRVVAGGLNGRLDEAHRLMERAQHERAMQRFAALVKKARGAAKAGK
jgi:hypothetical protein